jgi:hypothetical protein
MVSMEISQAQKDKHYCNLVCGIEKDWFYRNGGKMIIIRGWDSWGRGLGRCWSKDIVSNRRNNSEDMLYDMVITVHNILYSWKMQSGYSAFTIIMVTMWVMHVSIG